MSSTSAIASGRVDGGPGAWERLSTVLHVVECELNTACNRSCSYCPQSIGLLPNGNRRMAGELFESLLGDLARIDFAGRFSHHLYGEPLLDAALAEDVQRIQEVLPRAVQVLFTNGDLLDDARHRELLTAGVALFVVTRHSAGPYPERSRQIVQHAKQLHFTSRGGSIDFLRRRRRASDSRAMPCFAPTEMAVVSWDGRLLRCYEDARRTEPFGDLRTHTLAAIWAASEEKRIALQRGERCAVGGPCASCDNENHGSPGTAFATEPFWNTNPEAVAIARKAVTAVGR